MKATTIMLQTFVMVVAFLFVLSPKTMSIPVHPLCQPQIALANRACAMLPTHDDASLPSAGDESPVSEEPLDHPGLEEPILQHQDLEHPALQGSFPERDHDEHSHDSHQGHHGGQGGHHGDQGSQHGEHGGHHREHGKDDKYRWHDERRHHGHHHHHHHHSQEEEDCCRWLNDMDAECVCVFFFRLPLALRRPEHDFMVKVGDTCNVTFNCRGGIP
ncbi:hypothetical protein Syun_029101 [Stephania yunnanensis]|uniref:Uncharacterized protein n=1 Tax=Stephania yunnanensis TaxID=152371 RepID=A0AAP0E8B8_9MAGN